MHLLLVDSDHEALQRSAAALARACPGVEIKTTTDAMDAVRYSLNHPVDALYTEVLMPRCSGFDVVRLVRKFHPQVDAHILTATERFAVQAKAQQMGAYLLKSTLWAANADGDACGLSEDALGVGRR